MSIAPACATPTRPTFDAHDRVNYAVISSFLRVDAEEKTITLELTIDTAISCVMDYFEIFLPRMLQSKRAAEFLGCRFHIEINGNTILLRVRLGGRPTERGGRTAFVAVMSASATFDRARTRYLDLYIVVVTLALAGFGILAIYSANGAGRVDAGSPPSARGLLRPGRWPDGRLLAARLPDFPRCRADYLRDQYLPARCGVWWLARRSAARGAGSTSKLTTFQPSESGEDRRDYCARRLHQQPGREDGAVVQLPHLARYRRRARRAHLQAAGPRHGPGLCGDLGRDDGYFAHAAHLFRDPRRRRVPRASLSGSICRTIRRTGSMPFSTRPRRCNIRGEGYNIIQAQRSIASGGVTGNGIRGGIQSDYDFLKVRTTDFIFAHAASMFGFLGCIALIMLFMMLIWRYSKVVMTAGDTFGQLIAMGLTTQLLFQVIVNIGMNARMMPVTGVPLPFISVGGSPLWALLVGQGLMQSILMRHQNL